MGRLWGSYCRRVPSNRDGRLTKGSGLFLGVVEVLHEDN